MRSSAKMRSSARMRSRFWQALFVSILAGAFILSASQTASACSCGPRPTVLDSFDEADEVVILRAISVEKVIPVQNEETSKPGDQVEGPDGKFYVDGVRTTTMIVEKVFKGKLRVRDEIVFGQGRVIGPKGKPMSRVCVYLLRPGQEKWGPSDCTDEQGRFQITSIPAGEYVLVANQDGKPNDREPFGKIFYPSVTERERAAVINIGAGDTIDNIDIVIPKLEETITIEGVLRYSDGKPVVEEWVKFKVTESDDTVDGDVSEQTDSAGRFTLRVLRGLTGELAGEDWIMTGLYKNCPKVDELLAKSGRNNVTVQSNVIKLTTDQNVYAVELTLPFPLCEKVKE